MIFVSKSQHIFLCCSKKNVFRCDVTAERELFIRTELLLSSFAFIHCLRLFTIWKLNHGSELLLNARRIRNLSRGGQSRFSCRTHSNLEIIGIVSFGEQARRRWADARENWKKLWAFFMISAFMGIRNIFCSHFWSHVHFTAGREREENYFCLWSDKELEIVLGFET